MDGLITRLTAAQTASCTCQTKSPEVSHHRGDCLYRVLAEAKQKIEDLEGEVQAACDIIASERHEVIYLRNQIARLKG